MEMITCSSGDYWYFVTVGHIKEKDGFLGLYRGLGARLFGSVVLNVVTGQAACVSSKALCWYSEGSAF